MTKKRLTEPRPVGRVDLRDADFSGLPPEAAALARNMRVTLVQPDEGTGDPLEAVVDFLMAVKKRRDAKQASGEA